MARQIRARRKTKAINVAALERGFSTVVKARDEHVCRMERWNGKRYVEHGIKGSPVNPLDPSHIYSRAQVAQPLVHFKAALGLASCRDCHELYEDHNDIVRVPLKREAKAWAVLLAALRTGELKTLPSRRTPPSKPKAA
jgi:hypothetical protein